MAGRDYPGPLVRRCSVVSGSSPGRDSLSSPIHSECLLRSCQNLRPCDVELPGRCFELEIDPNRLSGSSEVRKSCGLLRAHARLWEESDASVAELSFSLLQASA